MSAKQLSQNSAGLSAGTQLAKAREAAGISEREVSDALNLPVATIAAIETDDHSQLPAAVFSRGYIRAYAKYLELDPDAILSVLPTAHEEAEIETAASQLASGGASGSPLSQLTQPKVMAAVGGVVALVLIFALWPASDNPVDSAVAQNTVSAAPVAQEAVLQQPEALAEQALTQTSVSAQPTVPSSQQDESVAQSVAHQSNAQASSPAQASVAEVADNSVEDAVAAEQRAVEPGQQNTIAALDPQSLSTNVEGSAAETARRLTPAGSDRLSIEFTEECWVEIKTKEGDLLYANLGRPGAQMEFVGLAPYRVLLGYAPGALLKFNQEPVALAPHTRNNVASLVVGQ